MHCVAKGSNFSDDDLALAVWGSYRFLHRRCAAIDGLMKGLRRIINAESNVPHTFSMLREVRTDSALRHSGRCQNNADLMLPKQIRSRRGTSSFGASICPYIKAQDEPIKLRSLQRIAY